MMKYQWFQKNKTCDELSLELGIEIKSITIGAIGDEEPATPGIEIEFEKEPTPEQLTKLDMLLPELKREGGKSLASEITQLKDRLSSLEAAKAEPNP